MSYSSTIINRLDSLNHFGDELATAEHSLSRAGKEITFVWNNETQTPVFLQKSKITKLECCLIDLSVDFFKSLDEKAISSSQFREFLFFLRDKNSVAALDESIDIKFVEYCFYSLIHYFNQSFSSYEGHFESLTKVQKLMALEKAITKVVNARYNDDVSMDLIDLNGKEVVLDIQAPGDKSLYLEVIQESLVEIFKDYELNCLLV